MQKYLPALVLAFMCTSSAFGWTCPKGQHWVQTPGQTNVEVGSCVSDTPPTTGDPKTSQSQTQSQNSSSNSNSTSNSKANSSSTSNATGGSSTSTATGGSATATGGSSTASNNSSGNVTTFSSVENQVRQTPMAYAPDAAFTTSPCIKGFSGGLSFPGGAGTGGLSKTDKGCDSRQTAVIFHALGNDTAAAKLLCSTDASKRAKLTLKECLAIVVPPVPQILIRENPAPSAPQVIILPAPAVLQPLVSPLGPPAPVVEHRVKPVSHRVCKSSVKVNNPQADRKSSAGLPPSGDR